MRHGDFEEGTKAQIHHQGTAAAALLQTAALTKNKLSVERQFLGLKQYKNTTVII